MATMRVEYAARAVTVLRRVREDRATIGYADLARLIDYPYAVWHEDFATILRMVTLEDPDLSCRVVKKATGRPGDGYDRWLTALASGRR